MKTFLPLTKSLEKLTLVVGFAITSLTLTAQVQNPTGNLLQNPSFESPLMNNWNTNNLLGTGVPFNGWNCTSGGFNILRVSGSGYASGANHASDGEQYVDVNGSNGYISSTFEIFQSSPITFRGAFSNREPGWGGYASWTGQIDILDANGAIVATSNTIDFVATTNKEDWYMLSGSSPILAPGTYTYRVFVGDWGHFDDAGVYAMNAAVLPIKLEAFTAILKESMVAVNWTVGEEINVNVYEVQVSTDGKTFKTVGTVAANHARNYSYDHKQVSNGTSYYRLKSIDNDGKFSYSSTCKVSLKSSSLYAYPNPANSVVHVGIASGMIRKEGSISIIAMNGKMMKQIQSTSLNQQESIDVSALTAGNYVVMVKSGGEVSNKMIQVMR